MGTVETVRGPIDAEKLGVTLMHEHIFQRDLEIEENHPGEFLDEDAMVARACAGLAELKASGVDTLVDVTVLGIGRDIPRIQRVAATADVHVVVATGAFYLSGLPPFFALHAPGGDEEPDVFERLFVADIRDGIAGTGVKAAIIKVATDADGMVPHVERIMRAAARAQVQTGVPITTHTHAPGRGGRAQQRLLAQEGVDLERVVIGHCGDTTDLDYLKELMDNGSCIGMDRFGSHMFLALEERLQTVVALCEQGYADRIVLSQDAGYFIFGLPQRVLDELHGPGFAHTFVTGTVVGELERRGVTPAQIRQMLVENPRRILSRRTA